MTALPSMGITMLTTCRTLEPARLAVEVEARGFESLWLPEHSHIPTSRATPFPGAAPGREELPDVYWHLNDQMVGLSMAAAVTDTLVLGTSVTLVGQHDPIWLAKQFATLDHLSRGRVEVGVGFGWNREEFENHGRDFASRWQLTRDHVGIMRALWTQDAASFEGTLASLESSWSWPKPASPTGPPLLLGGGKGPKLISHLFEWADGWMPIRTPARSIVADVEEVRRRAADVGRDPATISVTVMNAPRTPAELIEIGRAGIGRVAFTIWPQDPDEVLRELDSFAALVREVQGSA